MKFLICFLLIGDSFILAYDYGSIDQLKQTIKEKIIKSKISNVLLSDEHNLSLTPKGNIGKSRRSIVWKGFFDKIPVAIKITLDKEAFDREMRIFGALNAIGNPIIENFGIPNVYYHGPIILNKFYAIAMTLCDESIGNRFEEEDEYFSNLSILLILKRAIEILEYLSSKKVIHNDIKPDNMFLRGSDVFIGDFDCAVLRGEFYDGHTAKYASSSMFVWPKLIPKRYERDDLESLVYSMWFFAGCDSLQSDGYELFESKKNGEAQKEMMEKCKYFENDDVRKAFEVITADEMISEKEVPNFERMIDVLAEAIETIQEGPTPPQFEWLPEDMSLVSDRFPVKSFEKAKQISQSNSQEMVMLESSSIEKANFQRSNSL